MPMACSRGSAKTALRPCSTRLRVRRGRAEKPRARAHCPRGARVGRCAVEFRYSNSPYHTLVEWIFDAPRSAKDVRMWWREVPDCATRGAGFPPAPFIFVIVTFLPRSVLQLLTFALLGRIDRCLPRSAMLGIACHDVLRISVEWDGFDLHSTSHSDHVHIRATRRKNSSPAKHWVGRNRLADDCCPGMTSTTRNKFM